MTNNWSEVKFRDILSYSEERLKLNDMVEYTTIRVKRRNGGLEERERLFGYKIKTKKQFKVIPNAFIISRVQCWHNAWAIVPSNIPENMIASTNYDQFTISPDVDHRFFWWLSHSSQFTETVRSSAFGVVIEKMVFNREAWLEKTISLPPIEEQKHIVAKIESLMARIEEARRLSADASDQVNELISSELNNIFSDKSKLPITKKIEEVCSKPQYGYTDSAKYEPVGPKFLRITDIQNGKVDWEQVPYSSCLGKEKYVLQSGDLLFARSGATTGKSFLVKSPPESIFASYLIRIRLKEGILPDYLYWFFQSPNYWSQVIEEKKGSAQPNMNGKKLSNVRVLLPRSEETQYRIVAYLDSLQAKVDEMKRLQVETEKELEELVPSILDRAFTGEL